MDLVMCHCNMVAAGQKKKKEYNNPLLYWNSSVGHGLWGVSEIMATT